MKSSKKVFKIFILLSLLLCYSYSQDWSAFQALSTQQIADDPVVPSLISLGLQSVAAAASQKKQCTNCNFSLSQIKSAFRQILTGSSYTYNYQFECDFKNSQNVVLSASFVISYQPDVPKTSCKSFSYTIGPTSSSAQNPYIEVAQQQTQQDAIVKKCLDYGVAQAITSGYTSGQITSNQYSLNQVVSSYAQNTDTGTNYQFTCLLKSKTSSATVQATFTVFYSTTTAQTSLASYSYSTKTTSAFTQSFTSSTSSTTSGSTTSSIAVTNTSNSASWSSSSATTPAQNTQLTQISSNTLSSNSEAQYAQTWGSNNVIAKGIAAKKIPSTVYRVSQVVTVAKETTSKGYAYQFNILMVNADGVQLSLNYKVIYTTSTKTYSLGAWSYKVSNIKSNSGGSNTGGGADYVLLSAAGIQSSTAIQSAIAWGIEAVIKEAVGQKKIPNTVYNIVHLGNIYQKVSSSSTSYKCNILMGNADGVQLIINNTVTYKPSNQKYSLSAYKWSATNIKSTSPNSNSNYANVPSSQYSGTEVQNCLKFGVQRLIKNFQNYNVQGINSLSKKSQNSAVYYKFDVTLKKKQGNGFIQLNMVVVYNPQLKEFSVNSYRYHGSSSSSQSSSSYSSSSWSSYSSNTISKTLTTSQVNSNTLIKNILNYGVSALAVNLQSNNIIPLNFFSLSSLTKAWSQAVATGTTNYVFQVVLSDGMGTSISATFTIQYKTSTQASTLLSYQINSKSTTQTTSTVATYSQSASQAVQATTCQSLTSSQWSASSVQSVIQYGMQEVIKNLAKVSTFSNFASSGFSVNSVQSVSQSSYDSTVYNIQATFKNRNNRNVDCTYQVQSPSTGSKKLNSYSYVVY